MIGHEEAAFISELFEDNAMIACGVVPAAHARPSQGMLRINRSLWCLVGQTVTADSRLFVFGHLWGRRRIKYASESVAMPP